MRTESDKDTEITIQALSMAAAIVHYFATKGVPETVDEAIVNRRPWAEQVITDLGNCHPESRDLAETLVETAAYWFETKRPPKETH